MTRFLSRFRVCELAADSLPSFLPTPTLAAKPQTLKSPGHPLKAAISLNVAATVVPAGVVNFSGSEKKKGKARTEREKGGAGNGLRGESATTKCQLWRIWVSRRIHIKCDAWIEKFRNFVSHTQRYVYGTFLNSLNVLGLSFYLLAFERWTRVHLSLAIRHLRYRI